jgi:hypothetical protein
VLAVRLKSGNPKRALLVVDDGHAALAGLAFEDARENGCERNDVDRREDDSPQHKSHLWLSGIVEVKSGFTLDLALDLAGIPFDGDLSFLARGDERLESDGQSPLRELGTGYFQRHRPLVMHREGMEHLLSLFDGTEVMDG